MDFTKTENWIRTTLIKNSNLSFKSYPKGLSIFEMKYDEMNGGESQSYIERLNQLLFKSIKKINKKKASIYWFKINFVDSAIVDLVGMGAIRSPEGTKLLTSLILHDTADQGGDTVIGIFDLERTWILKMTNSPHQNRLYLKIYGSERVRDKLDTKKWT